MRQEKLPLKALMTERANVLKVRRLFFLEVELRRVISQGPLKSG
ncbi:hypothetical protein [Arcticibacter sp. MXS-1]